MIGVDCVAEMMLLVCIDRIYRYACICFYLFVAIF